MTSRNPEDAPRPPHPGVGGAPRERPPVFGTPRGHAAGPGRHEREGNPEPSRAPTKRVDFGPGSGRVPRSLGGTAR
ncbi:MAG: hypothetical protein D6708_07815 [Candidatus Dadabacteria bacterium]|nr:MAG: hypothetical protein D6708_07815 [Candidatus Dadabacteria bacterium]